MELAAKHRRATFGEVEALEPQARAAEALCEGIQDATEMQKRGDMFGIAKLFAQIKKL